MLSRGQTGQRLLRHHSGHTGKPAGRAGVDGRIPGLESWLAVWVRQLVVFVAVALLALVGFTLGQPLGIATSRQHHAYSELYFSDPSGRTAIADGQATLSFTIHNSTGRVNAYAYTVAVNGSTVVSTKTPMVQAGQRFTVDSQVSLPSSRKPAELTVRLANGQSIHTWVDRDKP